MIKGKYGVPYKRAVYLCKNKEVHCGKEEKWNSCVSGVFFGIRVFLCEVCLQYGSNRDELKDMESNFHHFEHIVQSRGGL